MHFNWIYISTFVKVYVYVYIYIYIYIYIYVFIQLLFNAAPYKATYLFYFFYEIS